MNSPTDRVIVGYDGSDPSAAAVEWAATEASRRGSPLCVFYCAPYDPVVPGQFGLGAWRPTEFLSGARAVAEQGADLARKAADDVVVTTETAMGGVAGALVHASRDYGLVVVGSRGHGPVAGLVLGSVAFAVAAHAPSPVVVVRGDPTRIPDHDHPVVVGVDGSPSSLSAARFVAGVAASAGAPLQVVSAWDPSAWESWAIGYTAAEHLPAGRAAERRAAEDAVERAVDVVREDHPWIDVRTTVVEVSPTLALVSASADAGLVVVGSRGRGGFTGLLLGSISHGVIHGALCPVAVVKR